MDSPKPSPQLSKDIIRALLDPALPDSVPWSSSDLRGILEHQLETKLAAEEERFLQTSSTSAEQTRSTLEVHGQQTFEGLLDSPQVAAAPLSLIKDYAKAAMDEDADIPRDVARTLYVLAILRGRSAGYDGISRLAPSILEREARRCLTFGWLPQRVQEWLRAYLS